MANRSLTQLMFKGIQNPHKILPYINRRIFREEYEPKQIKNGVVTWNTRSGFGWGDGDSPPQIAAINYHMVQALRDDLRGNQYQHAVEIGCGYGRVTPWLSEFANSVTGIDPNDNVLSIVRNFYPSINTICSKAQDIPIGSSEVDLLFTRSVLQHISSNDIDAVVNEMQRIASNNAHLLICEATRGRSDETFHPRPINRYEELFNQFELQSSWMRDAPAKTRENTRSRMFFKR